MILAKWALSDNITVKQKGENIEKKLHVEFNMLSYVQQCIKITERVKTYSVVQFYNTHESKALNAKFIRNDIPLKCQFQYKIIK